MRTGLAGNIIDAINPIERLRAKLKSWIKLVVNLNNMDASTLPEPLALERSKLLDRASRLIKMIKTAGISVDGIPRDGLGVVPVLVGGVVVAALAAIAYWTADFLKFKAKMDAYNILRQDGMSSGEARDVVSSMDQGRIASAVRSVAKPVAIIAGGYLIYKLMTK